MQDGWLLRKTKPAVWEVEGSTWHWWSFSELFKIVNELLMHQGIPSLGRNEFLQNFLGVAKDPQEGHGKLHVFYGTICEHRFFREDSHLPSSLEVYVPSDWGKDAIKLVRAGIIRVELLRSEKVGRKKVFARTGYFADGNSLDDNALSLILIQ